MKPFFRTCLSVWLSCQGWVTASPAATLTQPVSPESALFRGVIPIEIDLGQSQYAELKSNPRGYVEGRLTIAGTHFDRIGVHLKGAVGSFQPLDQKPSLTLKLDRYQPGQSVGGLKKLHLNNSVEDSSYLNEWLGSTLVREAGIPAPRVWHARVRLNGRTLGLYVLKEGFSREFLQHSLANASGSLLEPNPRQDVRGTFHLNVGGKDPVALDQLGALRAVLDEPDLQRRRERFDQLLDRDHFARFLAMEILLGHRDGYALARNNYRLYVSSNPTSFVFLPHGMDQLLQNPKALANPFMAGDVARSWMEIPENSLLYDQTLERLNSNLLVPSHVSALLEDVWKGIRGSLRISEARTLRNELERLRARAQQRHEFLSSHFAQPKTQPLVFQGTLAQLRRWKSGAAHTGTVTELVSTDKTAPTLRLSLNSPGWVSAETSVMLKPGRYRFRSVIRVQGFEPLPFGRHQGAFLRIAGTEIRSKETDRADFPKSIELEFEISGKETQVRTLVCELRGKSGSAWFDLDSLQIEQIAPSRNAR